MLTSTLLFVTLITFPRSAYCSPSVRHLRARSTESQADADSASATSSDDAPFSVFLDLPLLDEEDELDTRRPWERVGDDFDFEDGGGEATGTTFQDLLNFTEVTTPETDLAGAAFGDDLSTHGDRQILPFMSTDSDNNVGYGFKDMEEQFNQLDAAQHAADVTYGTEFHSLKDVLAAGVEEDVFEPHDNITGTTTHSFVEDIREAVDKVQNAGGTPTMTPTRSTPVTNLESKESLEETTGQTTSEPQAAPPIVEVVPPRPRSPSILIAVFSRRDAVQQRALVRDMWIRAAASSEGNATVQFTVCKADDGKGAELELEHAIHGDILILDCQEGYGHGLLTRKVIASMKVFQSSFKGFELFMKIDDDAFVSWHKLANVLVTRAHPNAYIGVPIGKSVPCRNASFRWYEPFDTYPYEYFPKAMAGGPGYTLGRHLVDRILDTGVAEQNLLWNEDRAVGVWINRLRKSHGTSVEYIALNGVDGWWAWNWKKPQESWKVWGDYPHTVHHGLRGDTIACLALADVRNKPDRRIDTCFAFEVGQEHEALKCAMQTPKNPSLLQLSASSPAKKRVTKVTRSSSETPKNKSALWRAEPQGVSKFTIPRGSTPDWKTKRQRLTFVHIPKNGGTAIEQAGQAGGVWWPRKWLSFWHGIHMPDGSWCEKYHVPPQYLLSLGDPDAFVFDSPGTFCVTRHPFDRAVSEYKYMLSVKWGRSMSEMYETGLYDKPRCTAEGLNNFLQRALANFLKGKRFLHDCHMVPQTEFIWGKAGKRWCRHVLSAENLVPSFNQLMSDYRYDVRLDAERINNSSDACPGLSVNSLELKTKRMLAAVYDEDLRRLNYSTGMKPLQFLHIPRNGGTHISELAASQHVAWGRKIIQYSQRAQLPDSNWCEKHHVPIQHMEPGDAEAYQEAEVFCVSRHPYERAVSSYKALTTMKDFDDLMRADGLQSLLHTKHCSAANLNEFLQTTARLLQSGQSFALDCQMAPQSEYIFKPDGSKACKIVLPLQDLPDQFNKLMVDKGFPQVQMNATARRSRSTEKQCTDLTVASLSRETREVLDNLYVNDFDALGYRRW